MTSGETNNESPQPQNDSVLESPAAGELAPNSDPFAPENLRLNQDFTSSVDVKQVLTTVKCRKPISQNFVRVRPGDDWAMKAGVFEDKTERGGFYLVKPEVYWALGNELRPVYLFTAINRQGEVFLWPCKLPGPDGRSNDWYDTALVAAGRAQERWIRVPPNMSAGRYDIFEAQDELSEPEWPDISFRELLELCFKDRLVDSHDHSIVKRLRGEE